MREVRVALGIDAWRNAARSLLDEAVPPEAVAWLDERATGVLPGFAGAEEESPHPAAAPQRRVPKEFLELARHVLFHRSPDRHALLYRALWRLTHGEPHLLEIEADPDTHRLRAFEKAVLRDEHQMHAFVRFRRIEDAGGEHFIAWHRPDHPILRLAAPFFARRFRDMRWTILTPDESVTFDGDTLRYGPGAPRREAPDEDALEDLWRSYYASVFNPARVKLDAMRSHMPVKHWATLPETQALSVMLRDVPKQTKAARDETIQPTESFLPAKRTIPTLRKASRECRGCPLYAPATQTVFGEGPADARVMLVGEQPGDVEDRMGQPFVGPAGEVLDRALIEAGLDRTTTYVTNAVKHFKFVHQGKRRLHQKPTAGEMRACRPWLESEVAVVRPRVLVCLGATAARSVFGATYRLTQERGKFQKTGWAELSMGTWHPSNVLRMRTPEERKLVYDELVADLRLVVGKL